MKAARTSLASIVFLFTVTLANVTLAQSGSSLTGIVRGASGDVQPGAQIHLGTSRLGAVVDSSGHYAISGIPAGRYTVRVTKLGFAPDTTTIEIADGTPARFDARLIPAAEVLSGVVVKGQRLGESQAAALERRESAPNVVTVLSGDDIRALPTLNAAEAAGRIAGVTTR
jgi:iron complex outermembrane receptor protein